MKSKFSIFLVVFMTICIFAVAIVTNYTSIGTTFLESIVGTPGEVGAVRENKDKKTDNSNYITDIYQQNNDAVISVINLRQITMRDFFGSTGKTKEVEQGSGSGFVYKQENGYYYAITNYHVVENSDQIKIVLSAKDDQEPEVIDAEIVDGDVNEDITVIRFAYNGIINPVTIGDSSNLLPGEPVVAMGSPYGVTFQGSVTDGIVSAMRKLENSDGTSSTYIQTDAAINSGNSGGPLFNGDGEVIGINSKKIADGTTDNIAFAIPITYAMEIIRQLELAQ